MPIAATAIKAKIVLRNIVLSSLFPCTPHNLSAGKTLPIRQKKPAGVNRRARLRDVNNRFVDLLCELIAEHFARPAADELD
jgi:hypothetical protein